MIIKRTVISCFFFLLLNLSGLFVQVHSQVCYSPTPYDRCSSNSACGCFPMVGTHNVGVCAFLWKFCSHLVPCKSSQDCSAPDHICVYHSRCSTDPVCYPISMMNENLCPLQTTITNTTATTITSTTTTMKMETTTTKKSKFKQYGTIVAGGHKIGGKLDYVPLPHRFFIDENKSIFILDSQNHRIVKWNTNENQGTIVAGTNGIGNRTDQMNRPIDMVVDQENNSIIVADPVNKRIVQWFDNQTQQILIENIHCAGLTMDKHGFLYVYDLNKSEVRRWKIREEKENKGTLVAYGIERGSQYHQMLAPVYMYVDDNQSIYISDCENHRVIKWLKDGREGILVAGGHGEGNNLNQLNCPKGLIVDQWNQIYVTDYWNHRIIRWREGDQEGEVIAGGNGRGNQANQFEGPVGLSFDMEGNLYISDSWNGRILRFDLIS